MPTFHRIFILFLFILFLTSSYCQEIQMESFFIQKNESNSYFIKKANKITEGISSDYEKAKAIYEWIAKRTKYDLKTADRIKDRSQNPIKVIRSKKATCVGYSALFKTLCDAAGIRCFYVQGYSKGWDYRYFQNIYSSNHVWNVFQSEKGWHLVDVTWGSSKIVKKNLWVKKKLVKLPYIGSKFIHIKDKYKVKKEVKFDKFDGKPLQFSKTHLPAVNWFQLQSPQLSLAGFRLLDTIHSSFIPDSLFNSNLIPSASSIEVYLQKNPIGQIANLQKNSAGLIEDDLELLVLKNKLRTKHQLEKKGLPLKVEKKQLDSLHGLSLSLKPHFSIAKNCTDSLLNLEIKENRSRKREVQKVSKKISSELNKYLFNFLKNKEQAKFEIKNSKLEKKRIEDVIQKLEKLHLEEINRSSRAMTEKQAILFTTNNEKILYQKDSILLKIKIADSIRNVIQSRTEVVLKGNDEYILHSLSKIQSLAKQHSELNYSYNSLKNKPILSAIIQSESKEYKRLDSVIRITKYEINKNQRLLHRFVTKNHKRILRFSKDNQRRIKQNKKMNINDEKEDEQFIAQITLILIHCHEMIEYYDERIIRAKNFIEYNSKSSEKAKAIHFTIQHIKHQNSLEQLRHDRSKDFMLFQLSADELRYSYLRKVYSNDLSKINKRRKAVERKLR